MSLAFSKKKVTECKEKKASYNNYICDCLGISSGDIAQLVENSRTLSEGALIKKTRASTACGVCITRLIKEFETAKKKKREGLVLQKNRHDRQGTFF